MLNIKLSDGRNITTLEDLLVEYLLYRNKTIQKDLEVELLGLDSLGFTEANEAIKTTSVEIDEVDYEDFMVIDASLQCRFALKILHIVEHADTETA